MDWLINIGYVVFALWAPIAVIMLLVLIVGTIWISLYFLTEWNERVIFKMKKDENELTNDEIRRKIQTQEIDTRH